MVGRARQYHQIPLPPSVSLLHTGWLQFYRRKHQKGLSGQSCFRLSASVCTMPTTWLHTWRNMTTMQQCQCVMSASTYILLPGSQPPPRSWLLINKWLTKLFELSNYLQQELTFMCMCSITLYLGYLQLCKQWKNPEGNVGRNVLSCVSPKFWLAFTEAISHLLPLQSPRA